MGLGRGVDTYVKNKLHLLPQEEWNLWNLGKSLLTIRTSSQYIARITNIYLGLHISLSSSLTPRKQSSVRLCGRLQMLPCHEHPHLVPPQSVETSGCVVIFSCHLLSVSPISSCPHCIKCRHAINIRTSATSCLPISARRLWFQCVPKEKASQRSLQKQVLTNCYAAHTYGWR